MPQYRAADAERAPHETVRRPRWWLHLALLGVGILEIVDDLADRADIVLAVARLVGFLLVDRLDREVVGVELERPAHRVDLRRLERLLHCRLDRKSTRLN